jgi:hypothetical protein
VYIAVDWSHTKGLTTYDGKKVRVEKRESLLQRLRKLHKQCKEAIKRPKSESTVQCPMVILEEGCPVSLISDLLIQGNQVQLISNRATEDYRVKHSTNKSDENDAKIMWKLARGGAKLNPPPDFDDNWLQLYSLYKQFHRYQKARVAMQNMKLAYSRYFGDGESEYASYLFVDTTPYDDAIRNLKAKENSVKVKLTHLMSDGESRLLPTIPPIKGLGSGIWAGIVATANPSFFKCRSAYLRFCGLTKDAKNSKRYSRHARYLYYMLAKMVVQYNDPTFRPRYDKCKADIAYRNPSYTPEHLHYAALNRTSTLLAKRIFGHVNGLMI